eukprot:m.64665 g.64665  ORF g.64665 m.64665 type:complete len:457 (-) comp8121_c0_seq1:810-2180(-)
MSETRRVREGVSRSYATENSALDSLGDKAENEAAERRRKRQEARQLKLQEKLKEMQLEEQSREDEDYQTALQKAKKKAEMAREQRKREGQTGEKDVVAVLDEVSDLCATIEQGPDKDNTSVRALQARVELLSSHMKSTLLHINRLQTHKISAQYEREQLRDKVMTMDEVNAEGKVTIQKLKDQVISKESIIRQKEQSLDEMGQKLEGLKEKFIILEQQNTQGSPLEEEEKGREEEGKHGGTEEPVITLPSNKVDADATDNKGSSDRIEVLETLLADRNIEIEKMRVHVAALQQSEKNLQGSLQSTKTDLALSRDEVIQLKRGIEELKASLASKPDAKATGESGHGENHIERGDLGDDHDDGDVSDEDLNASIELFAADVDAAKTRIRHLEKQNKKLRATVKEMEDADETNRSEVRKMKRELSKMQSDNEFLEQKLELKDAQIKKMRERRRQELGAE